MRARREGSVAHVNLDPHGYTVVTPSPDSRIIHVSSSVGDDNNDGDVAHPLKTFARATKLLRAGYPDWLLLKAGDTWAEDLGVFQDIGGRSADEPMVFSSYGSGPRPIITPSGAGTGMFGHSGEKVCPHVFVLGLEFYDPVLDPSSPLFKKGAMNRGAAIRWAEGGNDLLVEDCRFRFVAEAIVVTFDQFEHANDVRIRRNVITDVYTDDRFAQGSRFIGVTKLLIEENIFDHNGCDVYISECGQITVHGNLFLKSSSQSLNLEGVATGVIANNFFFEGEVAIGSNYDEPLAGSGFSDFRILNNVFLQVGRDKPDLGAIDIGNTSASVISGNIFSDFSIAAIHLKGGCDSSGITIRDNLIYRIKPQALLIEPTPGWSSIAITNNTIQDPDLGAAMIVHHGSFAAVGYSGNIYWGSNPNNFAWVDQACVKYAGWLVKSGETGSQNTNVSYPDPGRNLESYVRSLNPTWTPSDFYGAIRTQARSAFHPEYTAAAINDYIRAGFGRLATAS